MDKTYFLTGVTGYLGSKLLRRLEQMGGNFYCLKRKTSDLYRVKDLESRIFWLDLEEFKIESFFCKKSRRLHHPLCNRLWKKSNKPI